MSALNLPLLQGAQGPAAPLTLKHYARVYRTAAHPNSGVANSIVKMAYDTITEDPDNCFNEAAGDYVCPEAGLYVVMGYVSLSGGATAGTYSARVYLNGAQYSIDNRYWGVASAIICSVNEIVRCAAGDLLAIYFHSSVANTSLRLTPSENHATFGMIGT